MVGRTYSGRWCYTCEHRGDNNWTQWVTEKKWGERGEETMGKMKKEKKEDTDYGDTKLGGDVGGT